MGDVIFFTGVPLLFMVSTILLFFGLVPGTITTADGTSLEFLRKWVLLLGVVSFVVAEVLLIGRSSASTAALKVTLYKEAGFLAFCMIILSAAARKHVKLSNSLLLVAVCTLAAAVIFRILWR